jgi:DNA polymerase-3 subunit alpha
MGQGSIFDFGEDAGGAGRSQSHHRPPISTAEFDRAELLAMEKETLGTYLSSHPLAEVGAALRARVDCSLAQLGGKPDGAWVTVGGIVVDCKKIRTKSGSQMMFATLDDVEGQVEMLVFKADQAESAAVIAPDAIVLVRGRLDHKDRGETKLVVQEAQRFEPDSDEIASAAKVAIPTGPLRLTLDAASLRRPGMFDQLKEVFEHHKGEADVLLAIRGADGEPTEVKLGDGYRVRPSSGLRAELDLVLGPDALAA